ncbi:MAG: DUF4962 domain-containing protein [Balneolales bacterium]
MNYFATVKDEVSQQMLIILLLFCGFGVAKGNIQENFVQKYDSLNTGTKEVHMSTVYKRTMEYPEPSNNNRIRVNPPVLRWPRLEGKNVTYEVRLAKEMDFSNPDEIIGTQSTRLALFNPHQKLEPGSWYWQYKNTGGEWSDRLSFIVDETAIPIVSPPATKFTRSIPLERPRVLINKTDIQDLRNHKDNADARAIIDQAENALLARLPEEQEGYPQREGEDYEQNRKLRLDASKRMGDIASSIAIPLTQAYLLNGDNRYAEKAIQVALKVADWDPDGVTTLNDFGDSRCMLTMAIVYDTFYDKLSEEQKARLLQSIIPRASRFYNSWSNFLELRLVSGHVWQHILHYLFQTALALYDDVPEAENWLHYIYEVFLARTPLLGGMDGGWSEGVSYFPMNAETLIDIPLVIKQYTGFDFINAHPWYNEQIDWLVYQIPPGSAADGFGDNTEEINSPGIEYAAFSQEIAKLTGNPLATWYFQKSAFYEDVNLSNSSLLRWIRLTKTRDLKLPKAPSDFKLPMGRVFRDIGLVGMHTNLQSTPDNLMVAMRSSPLGSYGHMLSDQNVFNILYGGEKLFYRTGYKVTMQDPHRVGWYQNTKSQNGVLVNGQGQPYSTEAFGWIARFLQGNELSYAKGDASNAYYSEETDENYGVVKNIRHLVLLKPDIVVIYDELEAKSAVEWSWLIHSLEELSVDYNTGSFSSSLHHANGFGRLWSSDSLSWELTDEFEVPAVNWRGSRDRDGNLRTYDDDQWHLKATNVKATPTMRFLSVIRIGPKVNGAELLRGSNNNGKVEVKVGNWSISANLSSSMPPGLSIRNMESKTVFASHAPSIQSDGIQYEGRYHDGAKLLEMKNGKPEFYEVADEMPYVMKARLHNYLINQ